jgi:hypothetical protein
MGVCYGVTEKTDRLFMMKVREAMSSSDNNPMDGKSVYVNEFVVVGKEEGKTGRSYDVKKKKAVTEVQLTRDVKARRMYAMRIDNFSAESLQFILIE